MSVQLPSVAPEINLLQMETSSLILTPGFRVRETFIRLLLASLALSALTLAIEVVLLTVQS